MTDAKKIWSELLSVLHGEISEGCENILEKAMILSDGGVLGIRDFDLHEQQADNGNNATTLESMERNAITSAIKLHGGNMSEVARRLGITRQTLYNKMRKYGI